MSHPDYIRRKGKKVDTSKVHPLIRRQSIVMFCQKDRHEDVFRQLGIRTVYEAIEYVRGNGTPPGMSGTTWDDMVAKMSLFQEGAW